MWDERSFVRLRDCACTKLTLLKASRGGEPTRLTVEEWDDARNDKLIDKQQMQDLDELNKALVETLKVTYYTGNLVYSTTNLVK